MPMADPPRRSPPPTPHNWFLAAEAVEHGLETLVGMMRQRGLDAADVIELADAFKTVEADAWAQMWPVPVTLLGTQRLRRPRLVAL
jgi:hypothetical protein